MKIFDWVHRKFHTNVDYCMVSRKKEYAWVEEGEEVVKTKREAEVEKETEALLRDHVTLIKAFNGWPEGIFAIGTFGAIDPLDLYQDEYSDDGDQDRLPVDETNKEGGDQVADEETIGDHKDTTVAAGNEQVAVPMKPATAAATEIVIETEEPEYFYVTSTEEEEEKKKKKGERTTLADLFSAEAKHLPPAPQPDSGKLAAVAGERAACRKRHVGSLAKKLLPWKGEDSRPTAKIHRLLTKMMKRKIHPELNNNVNGAPASSEVNSGAELPTSDSSSSSSYNNSIADVGRNESVSLLQAVVES
ncbi:hypothetical protein H6P81_005509 [Aristolochia fimbriata]|uniref:Protein TILLER ANGLE CONTROL 1 n=1 Tax=Aristolochia fimbriata TaxID=158543 RepID=A0AAV7EWV0_ARIFI|nr:hypothetical protein H6P81_005509 [Aristolochia fimbriata]